ncbi:MAG: hypothetical protein KDA99_30475, partial [Planctomycetales bacterium]|nr:hypothetical protein [Planctomycetales bacterium]
TNVVITGDRGIADRFHVPRTGTQLAATCRWSRVRRAASKRGSYLTEISTHDITGSFHEYD